MSRLPDLVLPCWEQEEASLRLTRHEDGTVEAVTFTGLGGEEQGVVLSSMSQSQLVGWMGGLCGAAFGSKVCVLRKHHGGPMHVSNSGTMWAANG